MSESSHEIWPSSWEATDWIIRILNNRSGFDAWWDEIGEENRTEIRREIAKVIDNVNQ